MFTRDDDFWFLDTQPKQTADKILRRLSEKKITSYPEAQ